MLFGGDFSELKCKKAHITIKKGTKSHASHYYNLPRAYEKPEKKS